MIRAAELATWQAAQERARAAYDEAPDAFADALQHRCTACSWDRCHVCRQIGCTCRAGHHKRGWFTW